MAGKFGNLPGPGPGRTKGVPSKRVVASTDKLCALLYDCNFDPVLEQVKLFRDPHCPHGTKQKICENFLKLIYPAQRSVEHSGSVEHRNFNIHLSSAPIEPVKTVTVEPTVALTVDPTVAVIDPDSDF